MTTDDRGFLARALELAERGRGRTRPNPTVGCVVVRDGEVVGEGWHERAGALHAEAAAVRAAGDRARGATAYVTLEPCAHEGRTGPCADLLVAAGVRRVVFGASDPNPLAAGGGARLRAHGVEVTGGVLAAEVAAQNEVFFHVHTAGRPHVTLKVAQSLDGRVAARDGSSRWITSPPARAAVHALRADADAVLVGSGTVLADDPHLDVRRVAAPVGQPRPVVADARGRTPPHATVVRRGGVVLTTAASPSAWRTAVADGGGEVVVLPADPGGSGVDLRAALSALLDRDVHAVLAEGGPILAGALLRGGFVDRLVLHIAPAVIGGDGRAAFDGPGAATLAERWRWHVEGIRQVGDDLEVVARPQTAPSAAPGGAGGTPAREPAPAGA